MEFRGLRMLSRDEVRGVCEFLEVGGQERRDYGVGETRCQVIGHHGLESLTLAGASDLCIARIEDRRSGNAIWFLST